MGYVNTRDIIGFIEERCDYLRERRRAAETFIVGAPEGQLFFRTVNGKTRLYWRQSVGAKNGRYLSAKKSDIAEKLAQKKCAEETAVAIDRELFVLEKCLQALNKIVGSPVEEVHEKLDERIRELSAPIIESDNQYAQNWLTEGEWDNRFHEDHKKIVTKSGEKVRSKSEAIIAAILRNESVPFKYEHPLRIGERMIYPDFTVLDRHHRREIYWEHFGMIDDPDYAVNAAKKLSSLSAAGFDTDARFIFTVESDDIPFSELQMYEIIASRKLGAA